VALLVVPVFFQDIESEPAPDVEPPDCRLSRRENRKEFPELGVPRDKYPLPDSAGDRLMGFRALRPVHCPEADMKLYGFRPGILQFLKLRTRNRVPKTDLFLVVQ
jgi:hypothetical protein